MGEIIVHDGFLTRMLRYSIQAKVSYRAGTIQSTRSEDKNVNDIP